MTARRTKRTSRRLVKGTDETLLRPWQRFGARYPAVVSAYDDLREACAGAGPLDRATVALVKLATSIGLNSNRGVHAHARKALAAGVDPDALRQVALVALPTAGLPAALDALRWIDESIEERGR
jgi:4-carboxymuconolactone decarboxylase